MISLALLAMQSVAAACMCNENDITFEAASSRAELIFVGRVRDDWTGRLYVRLSAYRILFPILGSRRGVFDVIERFKGESGARVEVTVLPLHEGCGPELLPGGSR